MSKIFCIGWHKTGTSSVAEALRRLGYTVCDDAYKYDPMKPWWKQHLRKELEENEAFTDVPWPHFFPVLMKQYPDAYFIHTTRPVDEWIESAKRHFGGNWHPIRDYLYCGHADPTESEDVWRSTYMQHNKRVNDHASFIDNYLWLRIDADGKWHRLCDFLGHEVPDEPFPHVNQGSTQAGKVYSD